MADITRANVDDVFTHHPPEHDTQVLAYERVRQAARTFAGVLLNELPVCHDQQLALRYVRQASMIANAAIALKGRI